MLFVRWLLYFARPGTIKVDFLPAPRFPFSGLPADDQRRRSGASQLPPPPSPVLSFLTLKRTPNPTNRTFHTESDASPKSTIVPLKKGEEEKKSLIFAKLSNTTTSASGGRGTQRRSPLSGHRSLARSLPGKNNTHLGFLFSTPTTEKLRGLRANEPPRKIARERGEARQAPVAERKCEIKQFVCFFFLTRGSRKTRK